LSGKKKGVLTGDVNRGTVAIQEGLMNKQAALFHLAVVLILVVFGTWNFFQGKLEIGLVTLPFLIVYYLVFVAWRKKR
jgi:hypothetical protein